jgi:hypothetical protein
MSSMNEYTITRTRESSLEWMTIVEGLIGDYYQQTDPVDDIDRIYRQEEAEEWLDLLEAYSNGNADYNDLINWQPDYLRDIDGFNDYLSDVRTKVTWERNANYNIGYCEENGCRDEAMQRFYDKWKASGEPATKDGMWSDEQYDEWLAEQPVDPVDPGPEPPVDLYQAVKDAAGIEDLTDEDIDVVQSIITKVKGAVPTDIESAQELIVDILKSTVIGSAIKDCQTWTGQVEDPETSEIYDGWQDCVNVGAVLSIPGLDIPMPPGMVDLSVRDLIVLVQDAGESFEDFIQDPTGWLENKIEEAAQAVMDAWEGITDPKSSNGLFDILVDWGGDVLAGVIFSQVKDQIDTENPFLLVEGDCLTDSAYREKNPDECQQFLVYSRRASTRTRRCLYRDR